MAVGKSIHKEAGLVFSRMLFLAYLNIKMVPFYQRAFPFQSELKKYFILRLAP